jgi:hypothetical protein
MYAVLSTRLAVTQGTNQFSAAVSMSGNNAARLGATLFNINGATNIAISLQGSQDLANWEDITGTLTLTDESAGTVSVTGITFAYIRAKYVVTGAGLTVVVASDVYTSQQ